MLLSGSIYLFVIYRLISALRAVGKRARSPDLRPNAAISLIILRAVETLRARKNQSLEHNQYAEEVLLYARWDDVFLPRS